MSDIPPEAPEHCPGTASEQAGKSAACAGCPNQAACATAPKGEDPDIALIAERMKEVKHKVLVLSGKGGVGKSTFSAQLAFALAAQGKEVGLLDIDICGPSIPKMLGLQGEEIHQSSSGWSPVYVEDNLAVMSIGFMLPNPDEAVIWRGPRKNGLIKQFLRDVHWGPLDYLVIDAPPGTSDEHITITQCLRAGPADGAVIVTTPQDVSIIDVRKEISFCKKVGLRVLGVVENMAGLVQPVEQVSFFSLPTAETTDIASSAFAETTAGNGVIVHSSSGGSASASSNGRSGEVDMTAEVARVLAAAFPGVHLHTRCEVFAATKGGAASMCRDMGVPLLGRVPLDPRLGRAAEEGRSVFDVGAGAKAMCIPALQAIVRRVTDSLIA